MSHSIFDMRRHPLALCLCALLGFAAATPAAYSADKPERSRNQPRDRQGNDGRAKSDGGESMDGGAQES